MADSTSQQPQDNKNADNAYKANPFNRGFAVYMLIALVLVGLVMAYFLVNALRQASPGAGAHSSISHSLYSGADPRQV